MADANTLSLSLPTDLLTGTGGGAGLNLNYNFGPNVDTIANNAYSFLNQSFGTADTFQANSAASTQAWLGNSVAPIVKSVASEQDSYYAQILGAFGSTMAAQSTQASQAAQIQSSLGQSSISASKKAAKSGSIVSSIFGGGCFITTATCKYSGLPDDCDTLQTMRAWRDSFMDETEERRTLVRAYYRDAPGYVAGIESLPPVRQLWVFEELRRMIESCCTFARSGHNELALAYYLAAVEFARVASGSISV